MEQVRKVTSKVEDIMDANLRWIKPYLPALGRFLIVVTFLEDALRSDSAGLPHLPYCENVALFLMVAESLSSDTHTQDHDAVE